MFLFMANHTIIVYAFLAATSNSVVALHSTFDYRSQANNHRGVDPELEHVLECGRGLVVRVVFSPDGSKIATVGADKTVILWDTKTKRKLLELSGHTYFVASASFSSDGNLLATGSGDRTVRVWDTKSGRSVLTIPDHNLWVYAVAVNPNGGSLASGDLRLLNNAADDSVGMIRIWDINTGKKTQTLEGHSNGVVALAYSPGGKLLASGSLDGSIIVWEPTTARMLTTLKGHRGDVRDLAFSLDGTKLVSSGGDGMVIIWDVVKRKEIKSITGHSDRVLGVAFSPDGTMVASAGDYHDNAKSRSIGETIIWDVKTGAVRKRFPPDNLGAYHVAFSPDGKLLATAHDRGKVKLWKVVEP